MLLRVSTVRGLIVMTVVTMVTYTIVLRWLYPSSSSDDQNDTISSSSVTYEKKQSQSVPSILTHSPMHDELVGLQFRPLR